jgi:hypothetical protein
MRGCRLEGRGTFVPDTELEVGGKEERGLEEEDQRLEEEKWTENEQKAPKNNQKKQFFTFKSRYSIRTAASRITSKL